MRWELQPTPAAYPTLSATRKMTKVTNSQLRGPMKPWTATLTLLPIFSARKDVREARSVAKLSSDLETYSLTLKLHLFFTAYYKRYKLFLTHAAQCLALIS